MEVKMKKTVLVLHIVGISMMALWVSILMTRNESLMDEIYEMETNIPEPTIEYKTDTIHDTVKVREPYPVYTKVIQKVPVPTDDDSLEIEQKMYTDSTFTAWVSGYMPRLDSIEVYTTIIKDSTIIYQPYPLSVKKCGLWLHLGKKRNQNKYFGIGYIVH
jgi:hypothetical protein